MPVSVSTIIRIDSLFAPFYWVANNLFGAFGRGNRNSSKMVIIKFFGMGSIVRMANVLENSTEEKSNVLLITLEKNRSIVQELGIPAIFIRSTMIGLLLDIPRVIWTVWTKNDTRIVDVERSSNIAGLFRIIIALGKPSSSLVHSASGFIRGSQIGVSMDNKRATDFLYEVLELDKKASKKTSRSFIENRVLVNINAGDYLPERKYPFELFAEVLSELHKVNSSFKFVLTGGPNEIDYVKQIEPLLKQKAVPFYNASGRMSVSELMKEIGECELLISNDSGPMHIANYLATPTVVLWGPTSPHLVGYEESLIMKNMYLELSCSPCFKHPKSDIAGECSGKISCFGEMSPNIVANEILAFSSKLKSAVGV